MGMRLGNRFGFFGQWHLEIAMHIILPRRRGKNFLRNS